MEKNREKSSGTVVRVQQIGGKTRIKKTKQPLSTLQRQILEIVERQKYVGYADVLLKYYSFFPSSAGKLKFTNHRRLRKEIHAANAATCKAFNRLAARGLVQREIGGVSRRQKGG